MEEQAEDLGLVASALTLLRLIVGWTGVGLGVLNLAMGVDLGPGSTDVPYLIFHVVVLVTGLAWLAPGLLRRRPGLTAWLAGAGVTGAGLLISVAGGHGLPFVVLARGSGGWEFQPGHAVIDLIFWACLGFFALVLVTHLQPGRHAAPVRTPEPQHPHAEERAPAPHDENVGGLP